MEHRGSPLIATKAPDAFEIRAALAAGRSASTFEKEAQSVSTLQVAGFKISCRRDIYLPSRPHVGGLRRH